MIVETQPSIRVWGRYSELIQVLLNFLINAAQAMPKERHTGSWVKVQAWTESSNEVKLVISDNAKGIPQKDLHHIFEPFFSSKPVGEGTGLGLAISRSIIESHQATIEVASTEGQGTSFTLCFPPFSPLRSESLLESPSHSLKIEHEEKLAKTVFTPIQSRKILIVDDDLLVAKSLSKMLSYTHNKIASGGHQALDLLKQEEFHLILSDVMMPEMDGPSFFEEVKMRFPHYTKRFIFITGAAKGSHVIQALDQTGCLVLNKPITKKDLTSIVDQYT